MAKLFGLTGSGLKNIDFPQYSDAAWDYYSNPPAADDLWRRVAFVARCLDVLAGAVQTMPFEIVKGETVIDSSDDYQDKLGIMPDPFRLLNLTERSLFLYGKAYWFKERSRVQVRAVRYVVPTTITEQIDGTDGAITFKRQVNTQMLDLTPEDLIYMWEPDAMVELGPPKSCRWDATKTAAGLLDTSDQFVTNFLARGGVLPTMLMVKGMPAQAERERLESYWDKFVRGWYKVAGKIFNAEGFSAQTVGEGVSAYKDSQFTSQKREDICAAAGVPLSMLLPASANYATAEQEARWFRENTVLPLCNFISSTINAQLLEPLGMAWNWKPETTDAFQSEEKERALAYATYTGAGMKPSIAAQMLGLELPSGVEYDDLDPEEPEEPDQSDQSEDEPAAQEETPAQEEGNRGESVVSEAMAAERQREREAMAKALPADAWADLQKWQRKATKAITKGGSAAVTFESVSIPADMVFALTESLRTCTTADQVSAVFAGVTGPQVVTTTQPVTEIKALLEGIRLGVEALKSSYTPPEAVQSAARRGLELRRKYGKGGLTNEEAGEQGIGSGVQRATNLSNGDAVSVETLRRMRAFFSRHEKNKAGGEDDAGYIAWQLWGGDAGRAWAERLLQELEGKE